MPDEQSIINLPVIYANSLRLGMAFSDIKMYFGEAIPIGGIPEGTPGPPAPVISRHIDRVCVVMSPDLIPTLIDGLVRAVQQYQAQFGQLRQMPPPPNPSQSVPTIPPNPSSTTEG